MPALARDTRCNVTPSYCISYPCVYTCKPQSVSKCNVRKMKYDLRACQGNGDIAENVLPTSISHTSVFLKKLYPYSLLVVVFWNESQL